MFGNEFYFRRLKAYRKDDTGSLTIFGLFLFMMIIMIAGLAVDMAFHENHRVKTQNVIDTAVLAAASDTQTRDKVTVIKDHIAAAGLDVDNVLVDGGASGGENVAWAFALPKTSTMFSHMLGQDSFSSGIFTQAVERVSAVEVSLVLDFTSSMYGARINTLRDAVDDFINVVYGLDCSTGTCIGPLDPPNITVNVVPYGGSVNPGAFMAEKMGLKRWHTYSSCGVLPSNYGDSVGLPYGASQQLPHFYLWWMSSRGADQEFGWCPQESTNRILYAENDPQAIKDYMDGLVLNDGTGTGIGMKWGMALLDSTSRDLINELITRGDVTGNTSRTFPQDEDSHILKVVVVMTDGGITAQMQPYDFEFSHLYDDEGELIEDDDTTAERDATLARYGSEDASGDPRDRSEVELTETEDNLKAGRNNTHRSRDDEIDEFTDLCNLARVSKANGDARIEVFSIRFLESRQWTEDYMKPCATDPDTQYYDVQTSSQLSTAFTNIAKHINNLKLSLTN